MRVQAHLREAHGYTLAESVRWWPPTMYDIHLQEHERRDCGHTHEETVT